jgi:hypothetical protein
MSNREHLLAVEGLLCNAHKLTCDALEELADASDFERHRRLYNLAHALESELNDARKQINAKQRKVMV